MGEGVRLRAFAVYEGFWLCGLGRLTFGGSMSTSTV